ncbi:zinc-binding dehydrogenase [Actinocatenispora rupis]|uniref:Oxidoreductase n=1 Tax=Actinocatenispora rupis TaxID=519421 RepID=A0A8J3NE65_9ACTN|nr:zinc-binding dehydrogenase [Actinocatenispora rupis]GID13732.1 oxidoreductase [Actinocatenispora rupis]
MHAIRQYEFGPASTLRYEDVPDPEPAAGQVRIAVTAAGVHLIDTRIRAGEAAPMPLPDLPMTPGREVAGTVDALGTGVDDSWLGRRVAVHLGAANGGYAERAVADVTALHDVPDGVTDAAAVALLGTGRMTRGILHLADLTADDVVLVTSAAGGIGTLLVQAARRAGATVVGAAGGPTKTRQVRDAGAHAVDYLDPAWPDAVREALGDRAVSVVLDGVGGTVGRAALDLLGPGGRLLLFGWSSGAPTAFTHTDLLSRGLSVTVAVGPRVLGLPGGLRQLEDEAFADGAAGRMVPAVTEFPLADAAGAHAALERRETTGKVVLVP